MIGQWRGSMNLFLFVEVEREDPKVVVVDFGSVSNMNMNRVGLPPSSPAPARPHFCCWCVAQSAVVCSSLILCGWVEASPREQPTEHEQRRRSCWP
jgi:hypothetical protein